MNTNTDSPVRLVGFDAGGETFLDQDRIFRGIYPGQGDLYRQVLETCERHDLFRFGIVNTREARPNPFPDLPYDLVLEHERLPFVSYPHEWPACMLKDAALFHLDLYLHLAPFGLTIKDWHPFNILFKGARPIFVDFASIIPMENLFKEAYLTPPQVPALFRRLWDITSAYFFEMYRRMCVPYFLLPLYMMHRGQHQRARSLMSETILNASRQLISRSEAIPFLSVTNCVYLGRSILKKWALAEAGPVKRRFLQRLRAEVEGLSVSLGQSNYSNYYAAKQEELGFAPDPGWTDKQRVVFQAIKRLQPQTLLDLACNTGWFSVLATKLCCQVVAMDIDEACVDLLYQRAKRQSLPILPLVMDVTRATRDIPPLHYDDEPSSSLLGGEFPLILSAEERLKCDMVLALAIVHHLALGQGLNFSQIVHLLNSYTKKHLLVEFVSWDDKLVASELTFFPAYHAAPDRFGWYNLENFTREFGRHFREVEVHPSHPDSRVILICSR